MALGNKVAGVNVLVKIGTKVIGGQSGSELSRSANVIETTDKTSNGWITKVAGFKEWSVDCDAFFIIGDTGYADLSTAFHTGGEVDVEISTGEGAGHITWSGKAIVTDLPFSFGTDDAVTFSVALEGSGELLETIATV